MCYRCYTLKTDLTNYWSFSVASNIMNGHQIGARAASSALKISADRAIELAQLGAKTAQLATVIASPTGSAVARRMLPSSGVG